MSAINRVNEAYAAYHQHADETTLNSLLKATHAYVRLMVWDHAEPDDLAQCVTAHVWTILATYRQESKYSTWLRSVARRSISDYYRQRKAAEEQMPITEDGEPIEPSAEESLNDHPMRDASTLYRLTPDQRALVESLLRTGSYQDTAAEMGITATQLKLRVQRIRAKCETVGMEEMTRYFPAA